MIYTFLLRYNTQEQYLLLLLQNPKIDQILYEERGVNGSLSYLYLLSPTPPLTEKHQSMVLTNCV